MDMTMERSLTEWVIIETINYKKRAMWKQHDRNHELKKKGKAAEIERETEPEQRAHDEQEERRSQKTQTSQTHKTHHIKPRKPRGPRQGMPTKDRCGRTNSRQVKFWAFTFSVVWDS